MRKAFQCVLSLVLVLSFLLTSSVPAFAAAEEVYLSELRLVYAESYNEAKEILSGTEFKDYKILNENLNEDTGEIGVWLAYKETTDIEDAITDLAVMQMNGGYREGNYQEMIQQSLEEYTRMGETYLQAIDYFITAYEEGHYLAEAAYRQLNFYTVITDEDLGIEIPDYDGELLGDILYNGVDPSDLATIFMQGNVHVLQNIRSLLAMGVSYNEDGTHYLEKVGQEAKKINEASGSYEEGEYDDLALLIAGSVLTFQDMFRELSAYEGELDYSDEEITELEMKYAEYKSFADRMREVDYLGGKTLYDFCLAYELDESDLSSLYPLAAALNDGQAAMTRVSHYYDVVRYSMSDYPEEMLNELISEQEELYADSPFDVYTGVDRSIYYGTFALTGEAYRADAYTEDGFLNFMFKEHTAWGVSTVLTFAGGTALGIWAVRRTLDAKKAASDLAQSFESTKEAAIRTARYIKENVVKETGRTIGAGKASALGDAAAGYGSTYNEVVDKLLLKCGARESATYNPFSDKITTLVNYKSKMSSSDFELVQKMHTEYSDALSANRVSADEGLKQAQEMTQTVSNGVSGVTVAVYIAGGLMLLYSVVSMSLTVYYYYNPKYDDVPVALVDLIETVDGDRYIKYDVVYEAEPRKKGVYSAGDLNAFEAQRWNALYYTKSYEAGKPLLADEFTVSNSNNKPRDGYAPVHRFGEEVCYDLNKYNYDDDNSIYLSVKQSKNQKSAVADVPQIVGAIFADGAWFLISGSGALLGIACTLCMQTIRKKTKCKAGGATNGK